MTRRILAGLLVAFVALGAGMASASANCCDCCSAACCGTPCCD